mgnify:FL=1
MNKYDENKVLRSVSKVARIEGNHIIRKSNAIVGIHMWGKLDYLTNYRGYTVSRSNNVIKVKNEETSQKADKRTKNYGQLHRKDRK